MISIREISETLSLSLSLPFSLPLLPQQAITVIQRQICKFYLHIAGRMRGENQGNVSSLFSRSLLHLIHASLPSFNFLCLLFWWHSLSQSHPQNLQKTGGREAYTVLEICSHKQRKKINNFHSHSLTLSLSLSLYVSFLLSLSFFLSLFNHYAIFGWICLSSCFVCSCIG